MVVMDATVRTVRMVWTALMGVVAAADRPERQDQQARIVLVRDIVCRRVLSRCRSFIRVHLVI